MQSLVTGRQPRVVVGGYIDLGFFVPEGNGSGIIRDQGNLIFPQYAGKYGWVFLGDILSTAVNSRGEVADLGDPAGAAPPEATPATPTAGPPADAPAPADSAPAAEDAPNLVLPDDSAEAPVDPIA